MPGRFLVELKIDNATEIKKVNVPLLWIHGLDDSFLTVEHHAQLVFDNKLERKRKNWFPAVSMRPHPQPWDIPIILIDFGVYYAVIITR